MRREFKKDTFDFALNLFTSFGYFKTIEEHQAAINAMALNLKKQGYLIIDFMNVNKTLKDLVYNEEKKVDGIHFNITRKLNQNYIEKEIRFQHKKQNYIFKEKVMAFRLSELSNFVVNAKLKIVNIFGDYSFMKFNEETSDRVILICKK